MAASESLSSSPSSLKLFHRKPRRVAGEVQGKKIENENVNNNILWLCLNVRVDIRVTILTGVGMAQ